VFHRIVNPKFNLHAFAYMIQALASNDAGWIQGGSSLFAKNIEENFRSLGGKFSFGKTMKRILVEDGKAIGIEMEDGENEKADYVIAACDAHHLFYELLEDKHTPKYYSEKFDNPEGNPLIQSIFLAYSVPLEEAKKLPRKLDFPISGIKIGDFEFEHLVVLNHAFDEVQNQDKTCFVVLNDVDDGVYSYLKSLSREEYRKEKERLSEVFRYELSKWLKLDASIIDPLDVATPLTFERYVNAYHGSYQSFVTTKTMGALMHKGVLKGIKNFFFSGQWVMPPGGLPIAVFTAKNAAYRICHHDKKKFKAV
ncbi:MAG: FAD-dependent oxidoreductase, partial [Bacilli bacterium]|nr:FAD-dependent oxidoreductase [Bacilli bacterium]